MPSFRSHSVRFFGLEPRAIHCLAHSPLLDLLAVSRSDNSIELWNTKAAPLLSRLIPGNSESSVESLAWAGDRLFSCGLHGLVIEYDLNQLCVKSHHSVTSGPAWCLSVDSTNTKMAVGTEEGFVCLFTITEEGLEYLKVLDKQEGRILCLSWHSAGEYIATGSTDTIRVWNSKTGHPSARMTTGRLERNKETIIWSLVITDDFTIISGDSRGKTSFWDGKLGTLIDSIQSHKADVLTVAVNSDESVAYSSGVDPTIMHFQIIHKPDGRRKWVKSLHRQVNTHDVRCLLSFRDKIYSGGVDSYLTISAYPARSITKLPPIPFGPNVCVAGSARAVMLRYRDSLEVWRLGHTSHNSGMIGTVLPLDAEPRKLIKMDTKDAEFIVSCAVARDCAWISYSTPTRTRLYRVHNVGREAVKSPVIQRVKTWRGATLVSHHMQFVQGKDSAEARLLCASSLGDLFLFELDPSGALVASDQTLSNSDLHLSGGISKMVVGEGGEHAVVCDYNDTTVVVDLVNFTVAAKLPSYRDGCISAIGINPHSNHVVIAYSNHKLIECDVRTAKLTEFSQSLSGRLPREWISRKTPVTSIRFVSSDPDLIILHDDNTLAVIDKDKDLPEPHSKIFISDPRFTPEDSTDGSVSSFGSPGSTTRIDSSHGLRMTRKFQHLLHFEHVGEDEVVAVEVKPVSIEDQLPPSLKQKKFGTG